LIYFTADQHFGHENIIKYTHRPFKNANNMNNELIRRYNAVVTDEDTVYFIGDVSLSRNVDSIAGWVERLNGSKHLILGNHDALKPFTYVDHIGFWSVHTALRVEEFVLCHDPAPSCVDRERIWLCGHVHNLFKQINNVVNVGVDVWDFAPVSIEQIRQLLRSPAMRGHENLLEVSPS